MQTAVVCTTARHASTLYIIVFYRNVILIVHLLPNKVSIQLLSC